MAKIMPIGPRLIQRLVRRLADQFAPDQVILFGSHASGQAGPDSDVDLLVVTPVRGSKREKEIAMRVALHDFAVPKDLVVVRPEELDRQRNVVGSLVYLALREGQILYVRRRATPQGSSPAGRKGRP